MTRYMKDQIRELRVCDGKLYERGPTCIIVCEKSPSCPTSLGASTQMSRLIASAEGPEISNMEVVLRPAKRPKE